MKRVRIGSVKRHHYAGLTETLHTEVLECEADALIVAKGQTFDAFHAERWAKTHEVSDILKVRA